VAGAKTLGRRIEALERNSQDAATQERDAWFWAWRDANPISALLEAYERRMRGEAPDSMPPETSPRV
jgi:hypothetical protein